MRGNSRLLLITTVPESIGGRATNRAAEFAGGIERMDAADKSHYIAGKVRPDSLSLLGSDNRPEQAFVTDKSYYTADKVRSDTHLSLGGDNRLGDAS